LTPLGGKIEIAWYSEKAGEPRPLEALEPEARRAVEQKLRSILLSIAPLMSSGLGPLLGRALYSDDPKSLLCVGQEPLLTGWGMLPPAIIGAEQADLDRHFASTLGRYAPFGAPRLNGVATPRFATERPTLRSGAAETRIGGLSVDHRGLLIATGLAALCALLFALPNVLAVPASLSPADDATLVQARAITKAMQDKVAQARAALATADCTPDGSIKAPTKDEQNQLPPPPIPIRQDPAQLQGNMSLVARRATESVVFIYTCTDRETWQKTQKDAKEPSEPAACPGPAGSQVENLVFVGWGSGFFVAPKLVATNTHVVEGAKAVFVTNSFLGRVAKAEVKAATVKENLRDADFAALDVDVDTSPPPIELAIGASRLENVVAAGYPGLITEQDAQLRRLLSGDSAAAPELTTFPGFITVTMNPSGAVPLFYTSAVIGHGNSGGPLLDLCARAIGVNTLGGSGSNEESGYSINIAEGSSALGAFLDQHQIAHKTSDAPCEPGIQSASAAPPASAPPATPPAPSPAAPVPAASASPPSTPAITPPAITTTAPATPAPPPPASTTK
jgi:S1-C subfamily serine protease